MYTLYVPGMRLLGMGNKIGIKLRVINYKNKSGKKKGKKRKERNRKEKVKH